MSGFSDGTSRSVVWYKRDLRVHDHAPLCEAARRGQVLALYVIEPSLWAQPDMARQHFEFLRECLHELDAQLQDLGARLHVVTGEVVDVLARLQAQWPFDTLLAHEETGNDATFQRDRAVGRWCRAQGVCFREIPQFGVVRRLQDRDHWQAAWEAHMARPCLAPPERVNGVALPWAEPPMPTHAQLGLAEHDPPRRQHGGRTLALSVLHSFLTERCLQYRGGLSSPLSAPGACSRLSPYLALGCLSLREVVQSTRQHQARLPLQAERHRLGLGAFISRLYWHCHFIQKLESEPAIEWRNMHRGYDDLREPDWNPAHHEALMQGRTGWPLVDACVAMLRETGWINFRMRAMLVSVAAYPLWLHWRPVGLWLARQFLDYEPGIHWSQLQMQSGTTGINTTRVYNPIKQAHDHDPRGVFVRRWVPALRRVPDAWIFEPWRMPEDVQARCGVRVGVDIPVPLVDLAEATRVAKARLHERRARTDVRAAKAEVVQRHGSRQGMTTRRSRTMAAANDAVNAAASRQQSFDF